MNERDMEQKGLEEFKDVGGCWGCGIQESLNQAWVDCKTYRQALQEIKNIAERTDGHHPASVINMVSVIRHTINSVIGEK